MPWLDDSGRFSALKCDVLAAYLDPTMLRPGWIVLAIGLAVTVAAYAADRLARRRVDRPAGGAEQARDLSAADFV